MNFDDEISTIPLFDNIVSHANPVNDSELLLRTPKKSPSKKSRLQEIGTLETYTFRTPEKSRSDDSSVIKTPKSSLKSFASQTNLSVSTKSTSPEKILSSYTKLLNEEGSPKKLSPVRKLSLTPVKTTTPSIKTSSPLKGGTFMERRQIMLNRQRNISNGSPVSSKRSMSPAPSTPVKNVRVLKKVDFFSTPLKNDSLNKSPKRKLDEVRVIKNSQFNLLTPQSLNKTLLEVTEDEEGSPKKKQKSPVKLTSENVKQRLVFDEDDDAEEFENKTKDTISKETLDHVMFKQHMILKHEFGVGLNANTFDPAFDKPYLVSREEEYTFMISHLQNKLSEKEDFLSDCLSIVGPPGTGKSKQIWQLLQYHYLSEILEFKPTSELNAEPSNFKKVFCSLINCMAYLTVDQILETVSENLALKTKLEGNFKDIDAFKTFLQNTDLTIVLIMDEMDKFVQKHRNDLYRFLELAKSNQNFIIVSITNSFDIASISSDIKLNQLLVKPYTIEQISNIITKKLEKAKEKMILSLQSELPNFNTSPIKDFNLFQKAALTLICKKFGTQSGDLRDVTNFIYQLLEIRESKALFENSLENLAKQENKKSSFSGQDTEDFDGDEKKMSEYILSHWCLKPVDFKTVSDLFKVSSDCFNIQKLLNKLNIWQQLILVILCKMIQKESFETVPSSKSNESAEFKGVPYSEAYTRYLKFVSSLKNCYLKKQEAYTLLLDNEIQHNEFIKVIELLDASGIINKYKVKKDYYLILRYDYETIYQLLEHNSLLKDCIEFDY